jgi:sigma-B regulation protein RsbU (phosphoserine phosphatase)
MPLILRPRQQNTSDPLYTGAGVPPPIGFARVPLFLRVLWGLVLASFVLAYMPGQLGTFNSTLRWVLLAVGLIAAMPYAYRAAQQGLLWRLRNKLILTYLLIGMTPVVLFFTLVFLSAYVAAGQFAVHLAAAHLQLQLDSMGTSDTGLAFAMARRIEEGSDPTQILGPTAGGAGESTSRVPRPAIGRQLAVYVDGTMVNVPGITGNDRTPLRLSEWLVKRQHLREMKVFAADGGVLYMAVVDRVAAGPDHTITVIGSTPVTAELLKGVAEGLGQVTLLPGVVLQQTGHGKASKGEQRRALIGGKRPESANLLDGGVGFSSTLSVIDWETGESRPVPLTVASRPSVLFEQLFGEGLTGRITDTVRLAFMAVLLLFALLEVFALYLATRLTQSMTGSVEDLYAATLSIDSGNLEHRIQVQRSDQLADLCRAFNRMSWSLGRLIDEQKEKERMQSELTIAQEVQANLFPRSHVRVRTLDLHGICRPARTVSGDYYDFLVFHDDAAHPRDVTGLGLALGDISGKGISAALLMATLHSAVRAYRFVSEELFSDSARSLTHAESLECGELFESPARILSMLNRHLYRTTQPEKYATLFLAHYDDRTGRLTYSNGGQLPPFLLHADGSVRQLDRGGTVVGLLDNQVYEQETVALEVGDLVIAYSDGVTEPENDFGEFGEDRLLEVVRQYQNEPLSVISAEVMRALDAWIGGGEQPDDITLVLARKV